MLLQICKTNRGDLLQKNEPLILYLLISLCARQA